MVINLEIIDMQTELQRCPKTLTNNDSIVDEKVSAIKNEFVNTK